MPGNKNQQGCGQEAEQISGPSRAEQWEELIGRLTRQGVRVTKQRKQALKLFFEAGGFLAAMDIYGKLAQLYPGISYGTVYRTLRLFQENGLVEQFVYNHGVRYRLIGPGRVQELYHLICVRCEKTKSVPHEPSRLAEGLQEQFKPLSYKLEVYGYCSDCQEPAR
ncbi:Fur family transcriptional regulator [Paenibacillus sp. y28]|uniref:Fur family transcriptional regulator n=1 Tax=Paenibacillus sp. y28 TaxID=3129110 RepID=UPI00301A3C81